MRGQPGTNEIADAEDNEKVWEALTNRLLSIKTYRNLLKEAYPEERIEEINFGHIANAIGVYEGIAFRASNTQFDRFLSGQLYELSDSQVRGGEILWGKVAVFPVIMDHI